MIPVVSYPVAELLNKGWIYRLLDKSFPVTDSRYCFYVGLTQDNIRDRISTHIFKAHTKAIQNAVDHAMEFGDFYIEGIAYIDAQDLENAESYFIWEHKLAGYNLKNVAKMSQTPEGHEELRQRLTSKYPNLFGLQDIQAAPSGIKDKPTTLLEVRAALESLCQKANTERIQYLKFKTMLEEKFNEEIEKAEAEIQRRVSNELERRICCFVIDESIRGNRIHFGVLTADGEYHSLCKGSVCIGTGNSKLGLADITCSWCHQIIWRLTEKFKGKDFFEQIKISESEEVSDLLDFKRLTKATARSLCRLIFYYEEFIKEEERQMKNNSIQFKQPAHSAH